MADRTHGSDDMQAEARELAEDEALERWESVHGPFDDETEEERLGIPSELAGAEAVVEAEDWENTGSDASTIVADRVFALDVANDRSAAAVAQVGPNASGQLHMEIRKHERGPHWVIPYLVEMFMQNPKAPRRIYLVPGGQSAAMEASLVEADIEVIILKRAEYAAACAALYDGITSRELRHRKTGQVPLDWREASLTAWERSR